jgi:dTDP-glucose 4,6-dehydratase
MNNNKIIVTGGLGFIGTNLILNLIKSKYKVFNLDKNSDSSNKKLLNFKHKNYFFKKIDLSKSDSKNKILKIIDKFKPQLIINLASESHVDKSIDDPQKIYISNISSTLNLLLAINKSILKKKIKLIHIGTDEIYGDLNLYSKKKFTEVSRYFTSNPYSASKAAQINLIQAFIRTYNINAVIINPCNNYGFYQYPEKLIPRSLNLMMSNKPVELYGNGEQMRDWIFVEDTVEAIKCVMRKNKKNGDIYNLSSNKIVSNNFLIKKIFLIINKLSNNIVSKNIRYIKDRPGHDEKYASSNKKILRLGWRPLVNLDVGLKKTILFYLESKQIFKNNKIYLKRFGIS